MIIHLKLEFTEILQSRNCLFPIIKIIYKTIFYKILCCDTIIAWVLNVEKYRDVYKIEMNDFCDRMK